MRLIIERIYPVALGVAAAAVYLLIPALRQYRMPESLAALMAAVVSIGGISVGFLATAKSILISIDDKPIIAKLKKTRYYRLIVGYLRSAIRWSFFLTVWSALALLVDLKRSDGNQIEWTQMHSFGFAVWLFLVATAVGSYYRVISIFYVVLDSMTSE